MANPLVTVSGLKTAVQASQQPTGLLKGLAGAWGSKGVHKVPVDPAPGYIKTGLRMASNQFNCCSSSAHRTVREAALAEVQAIGSGKKVNTLVDQVEADLLNSEAKRLAVQDMTSPESPYYDVMLKLGVSAADLDAVNGTLVSDRPVDQMDASARFRVFRAITMLVLSTGAMLESEPEKGALAQAVHDGLSIDIVRASAELVGLSDVAMDDPEVVTSLLKTLSGKSNANSTIANALAEAIRVRALEYFFPTTGDDPDAKEAERNAQMHYLLGDYANMLNYNLYLNYRQQLIDGGTDADEAEAMASSKYPELEDDGNVALYLLNLGVALPSIVTRLAVACATHVAFDPAAVNTTKGRPGSDPARNIVFKTFQDLGATMGPICDLCMPLMADSYMTPLRTYFTSAMHEYNTLEKDFPGVTALRGEKMDVYTLRALLNRAAIKYGVDLDAVINRYLTISGKDDDSKESLRLAVQDSQLDAEAKLETLMDAIETRSDIKNFNRALLVSAQFDSEESSKAHHADVCRELHGALQMSVGLETHRLLQASNNDFAESLVTPPEGEPMDTSDNGSVHGSEHGSEHDSEVPSVDDSNASFVMQADSDEEDEVSSQNPSQTSGNDESSSQQSVSQQGSRSTPTVKKKRRTKADRQASAQKGMTTKRINQISKLSELNETLVAENKRLSEQQATMQQAQQSLLAGHQSLTEKGSALSKELEATQKRLQDTLARQQRESAAEKMRQQQAMSQQLQAMQQQMQAQMQAQQSAFLAALQQANSQAESGAAMTFNFAVPVVPSVLALEPAHAMDVEERATTPVVDLTSSEEGGENATPNLLEPVVAPETPVATVSEGDLPKDVSTEETGSGVLGKHGRQPEQDQPQTGNGAEDKPTVDDPTPVTRPKVKRKKLVVAPSSRQTRSRK